MVVRPQISFSPEGVLTFRSSQEEQLATLGDNAADRAYAANLLEAEMDKLTSYEGTNLSGDDDAWQLDFEVEQTLAPLTKDGDSKLAEFLARLDFVLPIAPRDDVDRILSFDSLSAYGTSPVVNNHLQRWMNAGGFTETAARHSIGALALPYGLDYMKKDARAFEFQTNSTGNLAQTRALRIKIDDAEFRMYQECETSEDSFAPRRGFATWRTLTISTLGDCACWSPLDIARTAFYVDHTNTRLYSLDSHNVDNPTQTMSLLLGVAALAYSASLYEGAEDIYRDVTWQASR